VNTADVPVIPLSAYSLAQIVATADDETRAAFEEKVNAMTAIEQEDLLHDWSFQGRPDQQEPLDCVDPECGCVGDYTTWTAMAGRGSGKTRIGSQTVDKIAWKYPGIRIGIGAPTASDLRDVIVEGESGLLTIAHPRWKRIYKNEPLYQKSNRRVMYPNGSRAYLYSAEEPRRWRGPQHHFVWLDELSAYKDPDQVLAMVKFGLRLPARPGWPNDFRVRLLCTMTPLPLEIVKKLSNHKKSFEERDKTIHVSRGSTWLNRANLDPVFFESIVGDYLGTRLGMQELFGLVLDDVPGALWKHAMIDEFRIRRDAMPPLGRVVVAVDPATTDNPNTSNETGIVVCGVGGPPKGSTASTVLAKHRAQNRHGYVLDDRSLIGSPEEWARAVIKAYEDHDADAIIAEANQGGDMVKSTIRTIDKNVKIELVHASRGKVTRAEPIVAVYEQGRIHHVGAFPQLEDQQTGWDPIENPRESPDRVDALVWGLSKLVLKKRGGALGAGAPISISTGGGGFNSPTGGSGFNLGLDTSPVHF